MARGSLRIYLGASPGVGKTYKMLDEALRRRDRGTDVVIGVVETHGRSQTAARIGDLEIVPRRDVAYRGTTLQEMDVDAVLRRRPSVVLVDEYAHTNAPGSRNEKRWQDVEEVLDAGIDVVSTLNVQHLESLNDVISRITGVEQRETVPDDIVRRADQLELVDMTPEAIRRRLAHGNIYPAERIDAAMSNYFRPGNLNALRELALLWVADRVEDSLQSYLHTHGISDTWETRERVVVAISGRPGGEALIRRASRMAGRISGDLIGVHVAVDDGLKRADPGALADQRQLLTELGGTVHDVVGQDIAEALVAFARREMATQLVLGASRRTRRQEILQGSLVARVTRLAGKIDVHIIHNEDDGEDRVQRWRRLHAQPPLVTTRRRLTAWALTWIGLPVFISITLPLRDHIALSTELLLVLGFVLTIAATGGAIVGAVAAVVASLLVNWYFVPPYNTMTIAEIENVVALAVFVGVAVTVGSLVAVAARRAMESRRARIEAEALVRSATTLAADPDPLPALLDNVRATFSLLGARIGDGGSHTTTAQAGDVSGTPFATISLHVAAGSGQLSLEVYGSPLSHDDHELLRVLADQLTVALDKRLLAAEAAEADKLADVDAVRTALLRAVSHDLRTPLASIKAMISGLRDRSVAWNSNEVDEAHATIEEETDRLNRLVGHLLDASRLQIGALAVDIRPTDIGAVVASAVQGVNQSDGVVCVDTTGQRITVLADANLLERSLDNLINNAVRHSRQGCPVTVDAAVINDRAHIRIVDRGPGVKAADRAKVVQPFQRLGDQNVSDGVGLGLAITQGFIEAMHGTLTLDDTPGGGLTVTITLPVADENTP